MRKKYDIFFWFYTVLILTLYNLTPSIGGFDVPYYFLAGEHFWNGQIDCLRTPVYPFLLKLFNVWFGEHGSIAGLIILQSIVYLISLVSLKSLAEKVIQSNGIRFVLLLFYVSCIAPGWCNELLTESLSISGCIILTDIVVSYINRPSPGRITLIHLLLLVLVFLRPTFILFFAILPVIWIYQIWNSKNKGHYSIALGLTIVCVLCFGSYCKLYEKQFGHFGVSTTFVFNKVYDAHRGNYWDPSVVKDTEARKWIELIDQEYEGTYDFIYNTVTEHPEALNLINRGCDDIINAHYEEHKQYRLKLFISSFDKRLLAAVNTHTPLSSVLFFSSLFLSFPVSLFYLITLAATFALILNTIQKRRIPLIAFFLTAIVLAQTVGIILTTSDAHERVLLPVYPVFLILLGIGIEKCFKILKTEI